ncbi:MAG: hypothetical protein ACOYK6_04950 [Chthoniobacterales bacterium]
MLPVLPENDIEGSLQHGSLGGGISVEQVAPPLQSSEDNSATNATFITQEGAVISSFNHQDPPALTATHIVPVLPQATQNHLTVEALREALAQYPNEGRFIIHDDGTIIHRVDHLNSFIKNGADGRGTIDRLRNLLRQSGLAALTEDKLLRTQLSGGSLRIGEDALTPARLRDILELVDQHINQAPVHQSETTESQLDDSLFGNTTNSHPDIEQKKRIEKIQEQVGAAVYKEIEKHTLLDTESLHTKIKEIDEELLKLSGTDSVEQIGYLENSKTLLQQGIAYAREFVEAFHKESPGKQVLHLKNLKITQQNLNHFLTVAEQILPNVTNIQEWNRMAHDNALPEDERNRYQTAVIHARNSIISAVQFGIALSGSIQNPGNIAQARRYRLQSLSERALAQAAVATDSNIQIARTDEAESYTRAANSLDSEVRSLFISAAGAHAQEAEATNPEMQLAFAHSGALYSSAAESTTLESRFLNLRAAEAADQAAEATDKKVYSLRLQAAEEYNLAAERSQDAPESCALHQRAAETCIRAGETRDPVVNALCVQAAEAYVRAAVVSDPEIRGLQKQAARTYFRAAEATDPDVRALYAQAAKIYLQASRIQSNDEELDKLLMEAEQLIREAMALDPNFSL